MVAMGMGEQYGIEPRNAVRKHLLPKIGTDVYQYITMAVGLDECRSAKPGVSRVGGGADGASACDYGDTLRGPCAEKG